MSAASCINRPTKMTVFVPKRNFPEHSQWAHPNTTTQPTHAPMELFFTHPADGASEFIAGSHPCHQSTVIVGTNVHRDLYSGKFVLGNELMRSGGDRIGLLHPWVLETVSECFSGLQRGGGEGCLPDLVMHALSGGRRFSGVIMRRGLFDSRVVLTFTHAPQNSRLDDSEVVRDKLKLLVRQAGVIRLTLQFGFARRSRGGELVFTCHGDTSGMFQPSMYCTMIELLSPERLAQLPTPEEIARREFILRREQ